MKRKEQEQAAVLSKKAQEEAHWCGSEGPALSKANDLHPPERPEGGPRSSAKHDTWM